jgi:membrane protein YdbS with pleckstrin-like domain
MLIAIIGQPPRSKREVLAWQEAIMISWAARGLLIAAGFVASWFVARDAPQFGIMQMAIALLLMVFIVAILAFWPERWSHLLNRLHKVKRK